MILTPYADIASTITQLTTLSNLKDKLTIYVKEINSWVSYDANSTKSVDNYSVFSTYNNVGRWIITNELNNNIDIKSSNSALSALRSVSLNDNDLLEYTNPLVFNGVYGITLTSGTTNLQILTKGTYSDNSWNFSLDTPIFVKENGILTQVLNYSYNYLIQIAIPVNSNTIEINKEIIYVNE